MLKDEMHYLLLVALNRSSRGINEAVSELGLTPGQPKVLEYLLEHDGGEARGLCQAFRMDKSTTASILSRMERQGLIRRTADSQDRRVQHIWLTEKGRPIAERAKALILGFDEGFWAGIDPEDLAATKRVLAKVALGDALGDE
jgi:DNA-binding MarR family transcriptional regulator